MPLLEYLETAHVENAPVMSHNTTMVQCVPELKVQADLLRLLQYLADRLWMDVHEFEGTSTESIYSGFVTRVSATVIPNAFDDDILSLQFTGSIPPITPHATRIMFEAPSA